MLKRLNWHFIIFPFLIYCLGFMTILSTSPDRAINHLLYFFLGVIAYVVVVILGHEVFLFFWKHLYAVTICLLFITYIFASPRFGSARWIQFFGVNLQPSEFAKLTLVVILAVVISKNRKKFNNFSVLFKLSIFILPLIGLVVMQPDLGTSIVLSAVVLGMFIAGGLNFKYIFFGLIIIGFLSSPLWEFLQDYQKSRVLVFINPQIDSLGSGYNVIQAMIAVGSGGVWGKGFGMGTQSSLRFLPAYWTDFIFAAFSEEWGFVGSALLLFLYFSLLIAILLSYKKTSSLSGRLIIIGSFMVFLTQFVINVGMNLGIMPVTGLPLPLMSYGGSSMVVSFMFLGLLQSVWIKNNSVYT